jgi:hypothetical protein
VQRGASNLYFPLVRSSLLIPPWDDDIEMRLGDYWADVLDVDEAERPDAVRKLLEKGRIDIPPDWNREEFIDRVVRRASDRLGRDGSNLRQEEWDRFVSPDGSEDTHSRDFELHRESVGDVIEPLIDRVVRVVRLRELRALKGFTRINPPPSPDDAGSAIVAPLSLQTYRWLPAVEVRGEGLFLSLRLSEVSEWEAQPSVQRRVKKLDEGFRKEFFERYGEEHEPVRVITPRFVLVHTFAHALMRQLAMECGYSTASLRERLYSDEHSCGMLIYTATTDADGTLGGLQRQGESQRIGHLVRDAVSAQRWCSSDPLCIHGSMMASNETNGSACHACVLAPETSCEEFNRFLDRALVIGTPDDPSVGFFSRWLSDEAE